MIQVSPGHHFEAWREKARKLIGAGVSPDQVLWEEEEAAGLFPHPEMPAEAPAEESHRVPASFIKLARAVSCHCEPRRWALLYRLLWRLTRGGEKHLLENRTDADVAKAESLAKAVHREIHKMHAFVRFRKPEKDASGKERYVAWFEPDHRIVEAAAPFFRDRFSNMDWSIFTPKGCAHWNRGELVFTPGVSRNPCDHPDELEEYWKTYYRSIFNPARMKIGMMRSEMPERYWKNLPEAELIPDLIRESRSRVEKMFETPERPVRTLRGNAYLESLKDTEPLHAIADRDALSLEELREQMRGCRLCPLWERATCAVPGSGPPNARVMMVGEQPGDQEDLSGQPFVGPGGQWLERALKEAGIDPSSVYLTYAVKHFKWESRGTQRRPQGPDPAEIEACRPWLLAEYARIAPEVVILMGNTAALSLLGPGVPIPRKCGIVSGHSLAAKVILTLHPSSLRLARLVAAEIPG